MGENVSIHVKKYNNMIAEMSKLAQKERMDGINFGWRLGLEGAEHIVASTVEVGGTLADVQEMLKAEIKKAKESKGKG